MFECKESVLSALVNDLLIFRQPQVLRVILLVYASPILNIFSLPFLLLLYL